MATRSSARSATIIRTAVPALKSWRAERACSRQKSSVKKPAGQVGDHGSRCARLSR